MFPSVYFSLWLRYLIFCQIDHPCCNLKDSIATKMWFCLLLWNKITMTQIKCFIWASNEVSMSLEDNLKKKLNAIRKKSITSYQIKRLNIMHCVEGEAAYCEMICWKHSCITQHMSKRGEKKIAGVKHDQKRRIRFFLKWKHCVWQLIFFPVVDTFHWIRNSMTISCKIYFMFFAMTRQERKHNAYYSKMLVFFKIVIIIQQALL